MADTNEDVEVATIQDDHIRPRSKSVNMRTTGGLLQAYSTYYGTKE